MKFLVFLLLIITSVSFPQDRRGSGGMRGGDPSRFPANGKIFGIIVDSQTLHAMEFVNISLIRLRDSVLVKGTTTNKEGAFSFSDLGVGAYKIKTAFIGYSDLVKDSIFVRPRQTEVDMGMMAIYPEGVQTNTVIITGQRDAMTYNLDKKVINVDQNIAASGGSALEVIENIPSVTVDIEGNVSLRGSSNINFLIDGKPTGLEGISSTDVLTSIPASSIESIELITNPSAKYDPEGTAGIINIVMKRKDDIGVNAVLNLNGGLNDRYNAAINSNLRSQYLNVSGGYSGRYEKSNSWYRSNRINYVLTGMPYINQNSETANEQFNQNASLNFDYFPDLRNTWRLSMRYRNMNFDNWGNLYSQTLDSTESLINGTDRYSSSDRNVQSFSGDLSYKYKLAERGHEIDTELDFNYNNAYREEQIRQEAMPIPFLTFQDNISDNTNRVFVFKADYENELVQGQKIEAGTRISHKSQNSLADYLTYDPALFQWSERTAVRNKFNYKEYLVSVYGTYARRWENFGAQAGLRVEHATAEPLLIVTNESYRNQYLSFFPSFYLSYNIDLVHEFLFNYSRRIDRPNERQLLPYFDVSDSLNIQSGNPKLKPQYIDNFELGYSTMMGRSTYSTTLFYKYTDRMISSVVSLLPSGAALSTYENIAEGKNFGIELMTTQPVADWFRFNWSASWYRNIIKGEYGQTKIDVDNISWNTRGSMNFTFFTTYQLQIMGNYRAAGYSSGGGGWGGGGRHGGGRWGGGGVSAQTRSGEMYSMDMALRADYFKRQLSVILRIQDVLDSRKFNSETITPSYYQSTYRKPQSRTVFLGITYRFNYNDRDREMDEDDDMIFF